MDVQRIAAFSHGTNGGNPAGVVLCDALPPADQMLAIAAEVGYSETAPTRSALAPQDLVEAALGLFCYTVADLDPRDRRSWCSASCPGSVQPTNAGRDAK
jgi:hypothetical protein